MSFSCQTQPFYNTGSASGGYMVKFGKNVTAISTHLFYTESSAAANAFAHVTMATIPDSVKSVGYSAFKNCYDMTAISIGKGVKTIEEAAFEDGESLAKVRYAGSPGMWKRIKIGESNDSLTPSTAVSRLTWTTSNKAVATVSSKGVVTAKKAGKATITVRTENGKSAKVIVQVEK